MSTAIEAPAPVVVSDSPRASRSVLAWGLAASVLLLASGALRSIQAARHEEESNAKVQSPFPLKELPKTVGHWHVVEGGETRLDDLTTRITGSTDYVIWKYKNEQTGTMVSALVLYGPAEPVVPHTPQVCYPATGFRDVNGIEDHAIKFGDGKSASFRANVFAKPGGRDVLRSIVYHSFRLDGIWSPGIADMRFPRKNPGIFKIQVNRRVMDGEGNGMDGEPIEQFLAAFLPALERQIADAQPAVAMTRPAP